MHIAIAAPWPKRLLFQIRGAQPKKVTEGPWMVALRDCQSVFMSVVGYKNIVSVIYKSGSRKSG